MARLINRLNPRKISELLRKHEENTLTPEDQKRWSDGNNGYLDLRKDRCSWAFISRWRGKPFEISFGSARNVPLADRTYLAGPSTASELLRCSGSLRQH